jgi:hypothetical protein
VSAEAGSGYLATAMGRVVTVTSSSAFTVNMTVPFGSATVEYSAPAGTYAATITLVGSQLVAKGDVWTLSLISAAGTRTYTYTAPELLSATRPDAVDVAIT